MDALTWETIFLTLKFKQTCSKLRVYIKNRSPSRVPGATVGLVCSTDICLSALGVLTAYVK